MFHSGSQNVSLPCGKYKYSYHGLKRLPQVCNALYSKLHAIAHHTRHKKTPKYSRSAFQDFVLDSLMLLSLANAHLLWSVHAHDYIVQDTWSAIRTPQPRHFYQFPLRSTPYNGMPLSESSCQSATRAKRGVELFWVRLAHSLCCKCRHLDPSRRPFGWVSNNRCSEKGQK
jgi:hypothetical protein